MSDQKLVRATVGTHNFSVHADSESAGLKAIGEHAAGLGIKGDPVVIAPEATTAAPAAKTASTTGTSSKK